MSEIWILLNVLGAVTFLINCFNLAGKQFLPHIPPTFGGNDSNHSLYLASCSYWTTKVSTIQSEKSVSNNPPQCFKLPDSLHCATTPVREQITRNRFNLPGRVFQFSRRCFNLAGVSNCQSLPYNTGWGLPIYKASYLCWSVRVELPN